VLLAEDEMAMYLQAPAMAVWAPHGQTVVVYTDPQRHKTNFYSTLNLQTGLEMVTQSPVMNAEASAQHLNDPLAEHPQQPILLLWDRAPWHFGAPIRTVLAANPRLGILHFPVATPDLNPQERAWKATRRAVSHNHTIPRLPELADKVKDHLTSNTFGSSFLDCYGFNALYPVFN
jgi:transposase